jgi:hypothetical protein
MFKNTKDRHQEQGLSSVCSIVPCMYKLSGRDYSLLTYGNLGLEFYAVIRISVITFQNCSRDNFQEEMLKFSCVM